MREVATNRVCPARIGPAFGKAGVDRGENGVDSMRQLFALGNGERDAGLLNLLLGTRQALAHRCRGDEKRGGDRLAVQSEHDLQHQRRADAGFDRRMRAREQQCEALVGDLHISLRLRRCVLQSVGEDLQLGTHGIARLTASHAIDQLAARDREQPTFGISRTAVHRPIGERRSECFRERVFGRRDVTRARREEGDELAVAATRHRVGSTAYLVACRESHARKLMCASVWARDYSLISQTGRTSITPWLAPGHRAAHESAASRSLTSTRK